MIDDRHIRTGIFLAPFHNTNENPTLALERDMDLVVHLDKLGYHEAWIGEHHSGGFETIASPEIFIAGVAERTRNIRLRHRRRIAALSQPVHARRPYDPTRPPDARPCDVRRRSRLARL